MTILQNLLTALERLAAPQRAYTGQYHNNPNYGLQNHRLHRLIPATTGATTFRTSRGPTTSEEIAQRATAKFGRIYDAHTTERILALWQKGQYAAAAGSPDEAQRHADLHQRFAGITPDDVHQAFAASQDFYGHLCRAVLEGNHGHGAYRDHVAEMLDSLAVSAMPFGSYGAQFVPGHQHTPAGRHTLALDPLVLGVAARKLEAEDPASEWNGNERLLSPEAVVAHEMAHFVDWLTSGSQVAAMYGAKPPPHPKRGIYAPQLTLLNGAAFTPLHNALEQYTQQQSGQAKLPFLPPNFTRLHYPTGGSPMGHLTPHEREQQTGIALAEWPPVLTELALHDSSALTALDRVTNLRDGHTADLVNDFWGFPIAGESNPRRVEGLTGILRDALSDTSAPLRNFAPADEASTWLAPLAASAVKNYADSGTAMTDKALYTRWGDQYLTRPDQPASEMTDDDVLQIWLRNKVYGPEVVTPERSPEQLREILADIRRCGTDSTGLLYLKRELGQNFLNDALMTPDSLQDAIEAAYYGIAPVSMWAIANHHQNLPTDKPLRFPEVPTAQNNYCGRYGEPYRAD